MKKQALPLKIGFASVDITPPKGVPLSGTSTLRPNEGVLHRIYAKVMILEQEGKRHVIMGVDAVGVKSELIDRLQERTRKLNVVSIICNASHTHCAPDLYDGFYDNLDDLKVVGLKNNFQKQVENKLVRLIEEGCKQLKSGYLAFNNQEEARFSVNRRRFYKGEWQLMPNFKAKIDQRVSVISAYHENGALMGVTYSYTCHTTTYYSMNLVSGDFVSVASDRIESELKVPAVFLQGPCGDIRPAMLNPEKPEFFGKTTVRDVERVGEELALAVIKSLNSRTKKLKPQLSAISAYTHLPYQMEMSDEKIIRYQKFGLKKGEKHTLEILSTYKENWFKKMLSRSIKDRQKPFTMPIIGLKFSDDLTILALGHELGSGYATLIQKRFPQIRILTLGYTNAMVTYVMPAKVIREGGYEGDYSNYCCGLPAPFSEVSEAVILDKACQILDEFHKKR